MTSALQLVADTPPTELNYSVLRNIQNKKIQESFLEVPNASKSQKSHLFGKVNHLQTETQSGSRSQIVAEQGEKSEDMSRELKL